jgi:short subunit dehydrogenase-like uncharacterized protein
MVSRIATSLDNNIVNCCGVNSIVDDAVTIRYSILFYVPKTQCSNLNCVIFVIRSSALNWGSALPGVSRIATPSVMKCEGKLIRQFAVSDLFHKHLQRNGKINYSYVLQHINFEKHTIFGE